MSAEVMAAARESLEMNVFVAQMAVVPGHPDLNILSMYENIAQAKAEGADMIVFPEMCVSGYMLGDDWLDDVLVRDFESYNQDILETTAGSDLIVVWGNVKTDATRKNEDGSLRKYNAVFMAQNGEYLSNENLKSEAAAYKAALPNYGEFDDKRYFYSLAQLAQEEGRTLESYLHPVEATVQDTKLRIGATICEDMWASSNDDDYAYKPVQTVVNRGAQIVANVSCSPWKEGKNQKRHRVVQESLGGARIPFVYANNVNIQNNGKGVMPFDGSSTIYNADGSIQAQARFFEPHLLAGQVSVPLRDKEQETILTSRLKRLSDKEKAIETLMRDYRKLSAEVIMHDLPEVRISENQRLRSLEANDSADLEALYTALVRAVKEFFQASNLKRSVIGLSGGSDSALVAKILVEAIGAENVYGVNMPTEFNSEETKDYALSLAQELGIHYSVVPIQESFDLTVKQMNAVAFERLDGSGKISNFKLSGLNKENVQARDRGARVLGALSSSIGGVFTNNGNKSEVLAGYSTFYGDLAGAIAPIGDIYKTKVWALMKHLAEKEKSLPTLKAIAESIPSAELSAEQSLDGGTGDPFVYDYHDKLWFALYEQRQNPATILAWFAEGVLAEKLGISQTLLKQVAPTKEAFVSDLERIYQGLKNSVIKGVQAPPNIRVSRKGRGFDMRETLLQDSVYYPRMYAAAKEKLLAT